MSDVEHEKQLWREVFCATIRANGDAGTAALWADKAVNRFVKAFKEPERWRTKSINGHVGVFGKADFELTVNIATHTSSLRRGVSRETLATFQPSAAALNEDIVEHAMGLADKKIAEIQETE